MPSSDFLLFLAIHLPIIFCPKSIFFKSSIVSYHCFIFVMIVPLVEFYLVSNWKRTSSEFLWLDGQSVHFISYSAMILHFEPLSIYRLIPLVSASISALYVMDFLFQSYVHFDCVERFPNILSETHHKRMKWESLISKCEFSRFVCSS